MRMLTAFVVYAAFSMYGLNASWAADEAACEQGEACPAKAFNSGSAMLQMDANSEDEVHREELQEIGHVNAELLQVKTRSTIEPQGGRIAIGGDHKFLLGRPCQRWAGDGRSGLPRHRVTGECCGDGVCSEDRWESFETCNIDCDALPEADDNLTKNLPPTQSTLFGQLPGMVHDAYHCEDTYDEDGNSCSTLKRKESVWLEDILRRKENGSLPFDLPGRGSVVVEFGCGLGQDSRNMAKLAGWTVTSVDVSPTAIEGARNATPKEMQGFGASQIEFMAYDAFALPQPQKRVDYFFDATVYCGMRHSHLARAYDVWSRIATPGHTLINIQCWRSETADPHSIGKAFHDMKTDFEPMFDIVHSEACEKNQGGEGWCFYMKMKDHAVREKLLKDRLALQHAARDGDFEYIRTEWRRRPGQLSDEEYWTLANIAVEHGHSWKFKEMASPSLLGVAMNLSTSFARDLLAYGHDMALDDTEMLSEDEIDAKTTSEKARLERMKTIWEEAEARNAVHDLLRTSE